MSDIRTCKTCGAWQSYVRPVCTLCHGRAFVAAPLPLRGEIYSLTTVQRAPTPEFIAPYCIALVRGPSGGLLMLQLRDFPATPSIGDEVSVEGVLGGITVAKPLRVS